MQLRLKELMQEKGVTSVALAEMIDVSKVTVSNLINNKTMPSLSTLETIAQALGVEVWELFVSKAELLSKPSNGITCPHCGKPITIKIEQP